MVELPDDMVCAKCDQQINGPRFFVTGSGVTFGPYCSIDCAPTPTPDPGLRSRLADSMKRYARILRRLEESGD